MSEVKLDTLMRFMDVKDAFGSYSILDSVEFEDLPAILEFAKIISNYKKMREVLKEN